MKSLGFLVVHVLLAALAFYFPAMGLAIVSVLLGLGGVMAVIALLFQSDGEVSKSIINAAHILRGEPPAVYVLCGVLHKAISLGILYLLIVTPVSPWVVFVYVVGALFMSGYASRSKHVNSELIASTHFSCLK